MSMKTVVVLAALVFGVYKAVHAVGDGVDQAMSEESTPAVQDSAGQRQDVAVNLALAFRENKTVAKTQFDVLNGGMINLRGTVTNKGPAARSIEVKVRWQDANFGAPEQVEIVDLGPFEAGETRSFDDQFANSLGQSSKNGDSRSYSLQYEVKLERVVLR